MLKAAIDTNLLVRGLLRGISVLPLIEALKDSRFQLVTSSALIAELIEVLSRDRLRK
ncbi:MAG: PIN domain-containing protein [Candidatus Margulisiibacteriota bacterium]